VVSHWHCPQVAEVGALSHIEPVGQALPQVVSHTHVPPWHAWPKGQPASQLGGKQIPQVGELAFESHV